METRMAPLHANIFIARLEEDIISYMLLKPLLYLRYINDIRGLLKKYPTFSLPAKSTATCTKFFWGIFMSLLLRTSESFQADRPCHSLVLSIKCRCLNVSGERAIHKPKRGGDKESSLISAGRLLFNSTRNQCRCENKHEFSSFHLNRGFAPAESVGKIRSQVADAATEVTLEGNCQGHADLCKPGPSIYKDYHHWR
ncbi:unnamed protein product [Clavelina lepadiformis]|uniref:Uncharacterized protein n=1 Tax=Clavelina lepadiformis TaxID=159417 RepID=A0ABP0G791_CLALP